jgi:phospholipid transport system transporter-binding protein
MSQFSIQQQSETGLIQVNGELSFATVKQALDDSQQYMVSLDELRIDLGAVTRSDSAGVALLVAWMRQAKNLDKTILFANVPHQMIAIASASGLDALLPLE